MIKIINEKFLYKYLEYNPILIFNIKIILL